MAIGLATQTSGNQVVLNGGTTTVGQLNAYAVQTTGGYYNASILFNAGTLATAGSNVNLASTASPYSVTGTNTATAGAPLIVGDGTHTAILDLQGGTQIFTSGLAISSSGVLAGNTSSAVATPGNSGQSYTAHIEVQGGGQISPGLSTGTPGNGFATLALSNLQLDDYSILNLDLNQTGGNPVAGDLIAVTGSGGLTLGNNVTVNVNDSGLIAGTYELISYAGTLNNAGDLASWTASGLPGGDSASFSETGSQVDMTVSIVPEPDSAAFMILLLVGGLPMSRRFRRMQA